MDWIEMTQYSDRWHALVYVTEPLGSTQYKEFLD